MVTYTFPLIGVGLGVLFLEEIIDFPLVVGGVLIFAGLTAYDTQKIKESYYMMQNGEMAAKGAIMGAVKLYLDFVNLFLFLLRFMGSRE